jgi:hypothetical protein
MGRPAYAQAPAALLPGTVNPNLAAVGFVAKQTPTLFAETGTGRALVTTSSVAFGRLDTHTQSMKVYAWEIPSILDSVARATGRLQLDFCVPRPDANACDSDPDQAASDIPVSITFGYGIIGRVHALGVGASAGFQATASVIDIERKTYVNYQELANLSASLGTVKVIAKIPIPIPDYESAEITSPVTFTTLITRGRRYRFMLSAASWADAFIGYPVSYAVSDFSTTNGGTTPAGLILLRDLTIHVSSDVSDLQQDVTVLQEAVSSVQEQVGALAAQVEALANANQEDNSALRAEMQAIPAGPVGPEGPTGPQGPLGATGPQGEGLVPGSLLMLPAGSPAPAGYTREGTFDLAPSGEPRGRQKLWRVDVYVRQATN